MALAISTRTVKQLTERVKALEAAEGSVAVEHEKAMHLRAEVCILSFNTIFLLYYCLLIPFSFSITVF
jgi:hypothetical protein